MKKLVIILFPLVALVCHANADEKTNAKVAVFARDNSNNPALTQKRETLETALSAKLNTMGISAIDANISIKNLNEYLGNPNAKDKSFAAQLKRELSPEISASSRLLESASAQRIAETLGAQNIVAVSISSFGSEKKSFEGYGIKTKSTEYVLRCDYSVVNIGDDGGSVGGNVKATKTLRQTENLSIISDDIVNALLDDCATQIASQIKSQYDRVKESPVAKYGEVKIVCNIADLQLPEIILENGKYSISDKQLSTTIKIFSLEIDGITVNAGEVISLSRGLHTIRVEQKDIVPVEKTINATGEKAQTITLALNLTDAAKNRMKEDIAFIETLKARAKASDDRRTLSNAEAEKLRGIGKMFEQSGYRIDTKNLPEYKNVQSIFAQ